MSSWLVVVILGLIEGITEFLPISSTGHLLLAEQWLPRQSDFFNIAIQSGAVLAVAILFREKITRMVTQLADPQVKAWWLKLFTAFGVTVAGVLLLKKRAKLTESALPVAWAALIGGLLFLLVEAAVKRKALKGSITWPTAIAIGIAQIVAALFPGSSRSGATILAAMLCGVSRPEAAEFSFLLGIPTLLAAGAYEGYKAIRAHAVPVSEGSAILWGFAVAAVTAFLVVRWLMRFIQTHTFVGFAWYRIVLGAVILVAFYSGKLG